MGEGREERKPIVNGEGGCGGRLGKGTEMEIGNIVGYGDTNRSS